MSEPEKQIKSNYEIARDQMEELFCNYDAQKIAKKFNLEIDNKYLYVNFLACPYRISLQNGRVEYSNDSFITPIRAGYQDASSILDVLCYSKDDACLSGTFTAISGLKGIYAAPSTSIISDLLRKDYFEHKLDELACACEKLGGTPESIGDVSYRISMFDFMPVILQYWDSDDEFDGVCKVLWDKNILDYMHFETTWFAHIFLITRLAEEMGVL